MYDCQQAREKCSVYALKNKEVSQGLYKFLKLDNKSS